MQALGVKIIVNSKASLEKISAYSPYAVILATGSRPIIPRSIKGIDGPHVYSVTDVLSGAAEFTGKNVCVIGSGMTGIETAEMLAKMENKVTVVEMAESIAPGAFFMNVMDVMSRLNEMGAEVLLKHKLMEIEENSIVVENSEGKLEHIDMDAVILSLGVISEKSLYEEISNEFQNIWNIGDSEKIGRIADAVSAGFELGYNLE